MLLPEKIYEAIRKIPSGRIATYGQIAALCGHPKHARQVGHALRNLPSEQQIPWHRVVNAKGRISSRGDISDSEDFQRVLLEQEGIEFDDNGRVSMSRFQWNP